jgi:hypothetical protein
LHICREVKGQEEGTERYLSPRKYIRIPKRMINLGDFHKDVLCKTVFEYYDKIKFPTAKKGTLALKEKITYEVSVHIILICFYKIVKFFSCVVHSDMSLLILLLLHK